MSGGKWFQEANDTVAKEPARDESLPRSGLLTRLRPLGYHLRHHRVGIPAWNAHDEEEKRGERTRGPPRGPLKRHLE